ncbi:MAG: type IV toxin-antitoxin system AbiEi family antitoxin domain-containing protein [bacterium]
MNTKKRTKINELISNWPKGAVYTASYLKKSGYHYDLLRFYKQSQWLESLGQGAYKLYADTVDWYGGVFALQSQLNLSLHVGGKTALQLKGLAHYVAKKIPKIFLYGRRGEKLPRWFSQHVWGPEIRYVITNLFPKSLSETFSSYPYRDFEIRISAPERAAMELLYHVPKEQGFDEAQKIMENLFTLRPSVVQVLLENCHSIKVKRLFMHLAEKQNFEWIKELRLSKIDFGTGERSVVKNGMLDKRYRITVPREPEI